LWALASPAFKAAEGRATVDSPSAVVESFSQALAGVPDSVGLMRPQCKEVVASSGLAASS
jgi:hypothetical protein